MRKQSIFAVAGWPPNRQHTFTVEETRSGSGMAVPDPRRERGDSEVLGPVDSGEGQG